MLKALINLSQNENLYGFPDKMREEVKILLDDLTVSSYHQVSKLREKLSKKHRVKEENIFLENGAEGALQKIFASLSKIQNNKILLSDIPWNYYKELATQQNIPIIFYNLKENKKKSSFEFDITEIKEAIRKDKPTVVLINNPHNPTGCMLNKSDLNKLLKTINEETLIILDETYFGFAEEKDVRGLLIKKYPNVVVVRSFSKYYSLAGIRMGYLLIGDKAREKLNIHASYLGHNIIAERMASIALDEREFYRAIKRKIEKQRNQLYRYFHKIKGFKPFRTAANFLLIRMTSPGYSNIEYANDIISLTEAFKKGKHEK